MPRVLACPACKSKLRVPDNAGGLKTKCPKCARVLRVPANRPAAPKPAAEPRAAIAPAAPPLEEVVLGEDQLDVVEEIPATPPVAARQAAPPPKKEVLGEDDVDVVEEEVLGDNDLDVVEEDNAATDDVEEVGAEPNPLAVAPGADPYAGLDVPESMQQDIRRELTKNEKIVWVGRPSMILLLSNGTIFRIVGVVALLMGISFLYGLAVSSSMQTQIACGVFGVAFSIFGVVFILARTLVQRGASVRNVYVVTNRRALILEGKSRFQSYTIAHLKDLKREDTTRLKGAGDLIFRVERRDRANNASALPGIGPRQTRHIVNSSMEIKHGFLQLENVKAVEKLIRETLIDRALDKALAPES
jgi:hypothetical protein